MGNVRISEWITKIKKMTEEQSPKQAEKTKSSALLNAGLIGFMIGIIIWSIWKNTIGLFTLIPLYFIYKLVNNPKKDVSAEGGGE